MAEVLDIEELIDRLTRSNITPEELVERTIRNLYSIEKYFMTRRDRSTRNMIRATIGYSKMLYDFGQHVFLAQQYLLHRVKVFGVRERDLSLQLSVLRDQSSSSSDNLSLSQEKILDNNLKDLSILEEKETDDKELLNVLDVIDTSQIKFLELSQDLEREKETIMDISNKIGGMACSIVLNQVEDRNIVTVPPKMMESTSIYSKQEERSCIQNRYSEGGPRMSPPNYIKTMMSQVDNVELSGGSDTQNGQGDALPGITRSLSSKGIASVDAAATDVINATVAVVAGEQQRTPERAKKTGTDGNKKKENPYTLTPSSQIKRKAITSLSPEGGACSKDSKNRTKRSNKKDIDESISGEEEEMNTSCVETAEEAQDKKLPSSSPEMVTVRKSTKAIGNTSEDYKVAEEQPKISDKFKELVEVSKIKAHGGSIADKWSKVSPEVDPYSAVESDKEVKRRSVRKILKKPIYNKGDDEEESEVYSVSSTSSTIEDRKKSNTTGPWESCDSGNDEEKRKGKNNRLERRVVDYKAPKGKSKNKDTTFKNPIKGRGTKIPIVVDKETSQVEKNYTHEKWLEMSGSELGARASDYIRELERQRKICGNLSGNVEGRMKDCTFVLSKLCEAFTEKTEILGDATYLKIQNVKIMDELNKIKKKMEAKDNEILKMRRIIIDLERQVNSLKEGNSVYASRTLMDGMEDPKEKRTKNERMKTNVRKSPYVKLTDDRSSLYSWMLL